MINGNQYIEYKDYYLSLHYNHKSDGLRWFHGDKYLVEVVINQLDGSPSHNIAPFVLLSSIDDALLLMVLTEEKAVEDLERQRKSLEQSKDIESSHKTDDAFETDDTIDQDGNEIKP